MLGTAWYPSRNFNDVLDLQQVKIRSTSLRLQSELISHYTNKNLTKFINSKVVQITALQLYLLDQLLALVAAQCSERWQMPDKSVQFDSFSYYNNQSATRNSDNKITLTQILCPVTLTSDPLTLKLVHGVLMSQGSFLPSLVFVGLFVIPLGGGTRQTDRWTGSTHDGASF